MQSAFRHVGICSNKCLGWLFVVHGATVWQIAEVVSAQETTWGDPQWVFVQEAANNNNFSLPNKRTLMAGLAVLSAAHVAVFLPLLNTDQSGPLLFPVGFIWGVSAVASILIAIKPKEWWQSRCTAIALVLIIFYCDASAKSHLRADHTTQHHQVSGTDEHWHYWMLGNHIFGCFQDRGEDLVL